MTSKTKVFRWYDCSLLEWTYGDPARTVHGLLQRIEDAPASGIHFHTHHTYLLRPFIGSHYLNDYANWSSEHLRDERLGERLSMVLPSQFEDVEELRAALIDVLENHLSELGTEQRVIGKSDPFTPMDGRTFALPSGPRAHTLKEWVRQLEKATLHSIYYHFYEILWYEEQAREKLDPASWMRSIGEDEAAEAIESFDPFSWNLNEFRHDLIETMRKFK